MQQNIKWIAAQNDFIVADVIRWTEAIWPSKPSKKKSRPVGKQQVIGQITVIDGDFVSIKIMKVEIIENRGGKPLSLHPVGQLIRKKKATLLKGKLERLLWSDESARATFNT